MILKQHQKFSIDLGFLALRIQSRSVPERALLLGKLSAVRMYEIMLFLIHPQLKYFVSMELPD
jgi:hypothetical protein